MNWAILKSPLPCQQQYLQLERNLKVKDMHAQYDFPKIIFLSTFHSKLCESESHSVVSDSLWLHGLYSPLNSPGQNTGVGSVSLLQGLFLTQE